MWEQAFAMTHQAFGMKKPSFFLLWDKYCMYVGNKVKWGPMLWGQNKGLIGNQWNKCSKCRAIREPGREGVKDGENEHFKSFHFRSSLEKKISIFEWQFVGSQGYLPLPGWRVWIKHNSTLNSGCVGDGLIDLLSLPWRRTTKRPHAFMSLAKETQHLTTCVCIHLSWHRSRINICSHSFYPCICRSPSSFPWISAWNRSGKRGLPL